MSPFFIHLVTSPLKVPHGCILYLTFEKMQIEYRILQNIWPWPFVAQKYIYQKLNGFSANASLQAISNRNYLLRLASI